MKPVLPVEQPGALSGSILNPRGAFAHAAHEM